MDTTSSIIGLCLLALCLIPFYFFRKSKKVREQFLLKALMNNFQISPETKLEKIYSGSFLLSLNKQKKQAFFVKNTAGALRFTQVDLAALKSVTIESKKMVTSNESGNYSKIEKLELLFNLKDSKQVRFLAYSESDEENLSNQLYVLNEWQKKLENYIK